jgi:small-conductance mechanosensitive channel
MAFTSAPALPIATLAPVTSAPTPSPTLSSTQLLVQWVLFGVAMLVAASSRYISRIIFSIVSAFEKDALVGKALKAHLEYPLTLALLTGFLYLGCVVFVPWSYNFRALFIVVQAICRFLCWCAIWYACLRTLDLLVVLIPIAMSNYRLDANTRRGLVEGLRIVEFVVMFIISIVLLVTIPVDYSQQILLDILTLFTRINAVTGVIAVALAPVLRDLVAGLTLLVDGDVRVNNYVQIWGVAPPGRVLEIRLRVTVIRVWPDDFVLFIPNSKMMRFPIINFSEQTPRVQIRISLARDTQPSTLRAAMAAAGATKIFANVFIDRDLTLVASPSVAAAMEQHAAATAAGEDEDVPSSRMAPTEADLRTEFTLDVVDFCRDNGLRLRPFGDG